jgi:hypothetical protein
MDEKDGDDVDGQKVDRLCSLLERLLEKRGEDAECDCNMPDGKHTKDCPCWNQAKDEDPEAEYELAGSSEQRAPKSLGSGLVPITTSGGENNVNPVAARDALQKLKSIRSLIHLKGTDNQIRAYNAAIRVVKEQIALAEKFNPRASAYDSRSRRKADAASFEATAAKFHGKAIKLHSDVNAIEDEHRAEDAEQPVETFDQAVERVRQEQIARYTPKRRR